MIKKSINITLTVTEAAEIEFLCERAMEKGDYYGVKDHYMNRLQSIVDKIDKELLGRSNNAHTRKDR